MELALSVRTLVLNYKDYWDPGRITRYINVTH